MVVRPTFSGNVTGHLDSNLRRIAQQVTHAGDRLLVSKLLRAVRNEGISLPVLPENVLKIQRMLSEPDCSIAALARVLSSETTVAAKFIAVANSPMYVAAQPISALDDAIVRVGLNQTSMVVFAIVARSRLFRVPRFQREADALYAHSLACGAICQVLARLVRGVRADDAFTSGLLQELGRIFVLSLGGGMVRADQATVPQRETVAWLTDELDAGFSALVAESWGYREEVVRALELHNAIGRTVDEVVALGANDPDRLTYLVAASDLMARLLVDGADAVDRPLLVRRLAAVEIKLDDGLVARVADAVAPVLTGLGGPAVKRPSA